MSECGGDKEASEVRLEVHAAGHDPAWVRVRGGVAAARDDRGGGGGGRD